MQMEVTNSQPTTVLEKNQPRPEKGYNIMDEEASAAAGSEKKSQGCTTREKILGLVIVILIIACIIILAVLIPKNVNRRGSSNKETSKKEENIPVKAPRTCTRPDCVEVAGKILSRMDLSVKPCDSFYQFSCGKWLAELSIPPDKSRYSMFTAVREQNEARVRELLSRAGNQLVGQDSSAIQKAKDFNKACLDKKAVQERGTQPMMQLIKDFGSWSATSGDSGIWNENSWNFFDSFLKIQRTMQESGPLFGMYVFADLRNVDENIINFDQSGLFFEQPDFYLVDSLSQRYKKAFKDYFAAVTVLLGGDNSTSYQIAEDVWQFETRIANITAPIAERQDYEKLYHKMTVSNLQAQMGDWINLEQFLSQMFGFEVTGDRNIVVFAPEYLGKIGAIVRDTSRRTLANYLVWYGVSGGVKYLPFPFQEASLAFRGALYGVSAQPADWKTCVDRTTDAIGQAVGALFVEKYFSLSDRQKVEEMLDLVKAKFSERVASLTWMDDQTKQRALEKAAAVGNMIGFPDMATDPQELDAYYGELTVTDDDQFENWRNVNDYKVKTNLKDLSRRPNKEEWYMAPNEVNAYYSPLTNRMVFPAGILQHPFYDPKYPMAVNFGAIGVVLGHELTHGFDTSGSQFDKKGNLKNWWEQKSLENFLERTKCIIDQFDNYKVGAKNVNGRLTRGENIADLGGSELSFAAYQQWLKNQGPEEEPQLPGLNMTGSAAFFLGFAQIWCSASTPQYAEQALVTDVHSPPNYRVIGTLSNMEEFSDVYNCQPGTGWNRQDKCVIW